MATLVFRHFVVYIFPVLNLRLSSRGRLTELVPLHLRFDLRGFSTEPWICGWYCDRIEYQNPRFELEGCIVTLQIYALFVQKNENMCK